MTRKSVMTPEVEAKARAMAAVGMTAQSAYLALGVNESTLRVWCHRTGVSFTKGQAVGRRFVATVMTPKRDEKAREMAAQGKSKAATAKAIGVSVTALHEWAKRKGVAFVSHHGASRYGLDGTAAQTYRLARKKGFSVDEALRIAGASPLASAAGSSGVEHPARERETGRRAGQVSEAQP